MKKVLTILLSSLLVLSLAIIAYADSITVTRAEWLSALETEFELGADDIALFPESFTQEPNAPATRGFAATTVNYFVGYELNQGLAYSFTDAEDVSDKNSAEFAVKNSLISLEEGKFLPNAMLTAEERDNMLSAAKTVWTQPYTMVLPDGEDYARVSGFTPEADGRGIRHTLYIPKKLGGKPVEYIDNNAFQNNTQIRFVNIPNTVISIGSNAFSGCTGITGMLTIPESVTEMLSNAFYGCNGITSVTIPVDFKYTYNTHPFYDCTGITEIYYTKGQTGIMLDSVKGSSNTANTYSDRLEFSVRNTLEKVSFEEGITKLGSGAYYFAPESYTVYTWQKLKTVLLPESLTELGSNAFRGCTALTDITLPEGVTTLGTGCFCGCTAIKAIEDIGMPASLTAIPNDCFNGCTGLEGTLTIPEQITELGNNAFRGCTGYTKVVIPVDFKYTYGSTPFNECTGITEIYYTKGTTGVMYDVINGSNATQNHYSARLEFSARNTLEKISFEEGVTRIGNGAYYNNGNPCTKLTDVILPESIEEIGSNAFKNDTSLEKLYGYKSSPDETVGETYAQQNNLGFIPLCYPVFEIAPDSAEKRAATQFGVTVHLSPDEDTTENIAWSVSGNSSEATVISSSGELYVPLEETADTLTVSATYKNKATNSVQIIVIKHIQKVTLTGAIEKSYDIERGYGFGRPTELEEKGYEYKYFNVDGDNRTEITSGQWPVAVEDDLTIDVTKTEIFYNITYHLNGGTNNEENPEKYSAVTGKVTLKSPVKTHYTFKGWFTTENGNEQYSDETVYEGDLDAYARWEFAEHIWDGGTVTAEPTCISEGTKVYKCTIEGCEEKYSESVDITPHAYSSEWSADDENHWHKCTNPDCTSVDSLSAHEWGECTFVNGAHKKVCLVCNKEEEMPLTKVPASPATAENAGNKEYYVCTGCGKYFADAQGKTEITDKNSVVIPKIALTPEEAAMPTEEKTEELIQKTNTDKKDVAGAEYQRLMLKATSKKKTITLKWKRINGASGYIIYGAPCGQKMTRLATIKNGKTVKKTFKKLKKGTYYKYIVVAYKKTAAGNRIMSKSKSVHCATPGGKKGNPTGIKLKKTKITLKKGKKTKIKATLLKKGKVATHIAKFRYESSNKKIATVDKKGNIKAKKKGSVTIYVYAQNGFCKTIKVKVK